MVLPMMKKYSFLNKKLFSALIIFFLVSNFFSAADKSTASWVLAAEKFTYTNKTVDSLYDAIASLLPTRILGSTGSNLFRTVYVDESYERNIYSLKNERSSLFLQLSGEIKKRDALVLSNYDRHKLKTELKKEDEKINEIKKKLDENITKQKEENELLAQFLESGQEINEKTPESELEKYANFFKNFIYEKQDQAIIEEISFYKNDISSLYEAGNEAKADGYKSNAFEKEMLNAKINGLISGEITVYEEYIYTAVSLYVYPGAKYITTVSEVGTIDELDFIAESLGQQLIPSLTNSMPISLKVTINPPQAASSAQMYIDGNLIQNLNNEVNLDSGVHFIQFSASNYKSAETSYFFTGNRKYLIEVNLKELVQGQMYLTTEAPDNKNNFLSIIGGLFEPDLEKENVSFYANGIQTEENDGKAKIQINGDLILGQFVSENGESGFYYIMPDQSISEQLLYVKPEVFNRNDYIEKHRRRMYTAYSGLVVSLIPYFVTKGQYQNHLAARENDKAFIWNISNKVAAGISIGCGIWFVYEMVRYFMAADSVIPQKAEVIGRYVPPVVEDKNVAEEVTVIEEEMVIEEVEENKNEEILR